MTVPVTSAPLSPRITWARPGDVITAPGTLGLLEPTYVFSRCEHKAVGYFCEIHADTLRHAEDLVIHLEQPGRHHIAAYCPRHRIFEAPDDVQMQLLAGQSGAAA